MSSAAPVALHANATSDHIESAYDQGHAVTHVIEALVADGQQAPLPGGDIAGVELQRREHRTCGDRGIAYPYPHRVPASSGGSVPATAWRKVPSA